MNTYDDIIDTRDIISRFEELEDQLFNGIDSDMLAEGTSEHAAALAEFEVLQTILEELCGAGGDEKWRGDWYPLTLIRDSYFEQYMDQLIDDIGDIPRDLPAYIRIELDYTMLQQDYTSIEIDGVDYWYR